MYLLNFNSTDPRRASFFELYAQYELNTHIKPAAEYITSVLSTRFSSAAFLLRHFDELYYSFQFLVERFYLSNYDASFSENFYSLKRSLVSDDKDSGPASLTRKQQWLSLVFLVLIPYFKTKLESYYKEKSGFADANSEFIHENEEEPPKSLFVSIYPYFNLLYEGGMLAYQICYMYDATRFYNFFLHFQRIEVSRQLLPDMMEQQKAVQMKRNKFLLKWSGKGVLGFLVRFLYRSNNLFFDYFPYLLPLLIFAFKFAEWWYSTNNPAGQNKPIPPPPVPPQPSHNGISLPLDKRDCPLCLEVRTNPAVLSSSGFVFCYKCIMDFLLEKSYCPITLLPASRDQVRKVFESA